MDSGLHQSIISTLEQALNVLSREIEMKNFQIIKLQNEVSKLKLKPQNNANTILPPYLANIFNGFYGYFITLMYCINSYSCTIYVLHVRV